MVDTNLTLKRVLATIGVFALVGIGLGLTGYIGIDTASDLLLSEDGGGFGQTLVALIFIQSVFITWFVGPVVALVSGLANARSMPASTAALSTGVGSAFGFLVMIGIAIALMVLAMPETGGGGGGGTGGAPLTDQLGTMILVAIPTTIVGAVTGGLGSAVFE